MYKYKTMTDSDDIANDEKWHFNADTLATTGVLWEDSTEVILTQWANDSRKESEAHGRHGICKRLLFQVLSCIVTALPFVSVNVPLDTKNEEKFIRVIMIFIGVLSAILTVFNWGRQYTAHFHYEALFQGLSQKIHAELSKSKLKRSSAEAFVTETRMALLNYRQLAPHI